MSDRLVWRQAHWPRPLDAAGAVAAPRAWAADQRSPLIVLEARADERGVQYLLGAPVAAQAAVERRLTAAVPGAALTELNGERLAVSAAGRLKLSTRHRALRTDLPEMAVRQVLGALTAVNKGELLVLQLVLGPRRIPLAVPNQSPSSIVRPWYQVAWHGNGGTVDGEKRTALRDKVGDHGFAATLRLGALAVDPDRRRNLILGLYAALRVSEAPGLQTKLVRERAEQLNRAAQPWRWPLRLNVAETLALSGWPFGDDDLPGQRRRRPGRLRFLRLAGRCGRRPAAALAGRSRGRPAARPPQGALAALAGALPHGRGGAPGAAGAGESAPSRGAVGRDRTTLLAALHADQRQSRDAEARPAGGDRPG
jgi:hypothetical protein